MFYYKLNLNYKYLRMKSINKTIDRFIERLNGIKLNTKRSNNNNYEIKKKTLITQTTIESEHIIEFSKKLPILTRCQVLVVGGGPAGLSAAISSARCGVDTVIIDKFGCFGGVITTVGMETIAWYRYEGTTDCSGIGIEMEKMADKMGGSIKWPYNDSQCLDADFFKIVADRLILESGARPILHCYATDVIIDNRTIKGIIVESKSGRQAILADRVIDCTGDADIAFFSGITFRQNNLKDTLGITPVFGCSGVNKQQFLEYTEKKKSTYREWGEDWTNECSEHVKDLKTPYLDEEFSLAKQNQHIPSNTHNFNGTWSSISEAGEATNLNLIYLKGYDTTNVLDLTTAEMEGRAQTLHAIEALKRNIPGFQQAKLRTFGMTIGIRDTRKIIGRYNLTENDVKNQATFEDSIGIFPEFIDGYNVLTLPVTGRYFQVPYGCLVPLEIDNLLVAGRCCAGDNISHAAMRNMMACTVTGQGAGVAAAVSILQDTTTSQVNISNVQQKLLEQGVRIK